MHLIKAEATLFKHRKEWRFPIYNQQLLLFVRNVRYRKFRDYFMKILTWPYISIRFYSWKRGLEQHYLNHELWAVSIFFELFIHNNTTDCIG